MTAFSLIAFHFWLNPLPGTLSIAMHSAFFCWEHGWPLVHVFVFFSLDGQDGQGFWKDIEQGTRNDGLLLSIGVLRWMRREKFWGMTERTIWDLMPCGMGCLSCCGVCVCVLLPLECNERGGGEKNKGGWPQYRACVLEGEGIKCAVVFRFCYRRRRFVWIMWLFWGNLFKTCGKTNKKKKIRLLLKKKKEKEKKRHVVSSVPSERFVFFSLRTHVFLWTAKARKISERSTTFLRKREQRKRRVCSDIFTEKEKKNISANPGGIQEFCVVRILWNFRSCEKFADLNKDISVWKKPNRKFA